MANLGTDLAAIRVRCEAYAKAHPAYSQDDLWELNLTPDAVPFFLHAQTNLPRLLARMEEMRKALTRYGRHLESCHIKQRHDDRSTCLSDMSHECTCGIVAALNRPLDAPG